MRAGPTQEEIRRRNLGALLRHVHMRGPTSRADLTASMGLNRSTIGALTADLAEVGLVREEVPRDTGRAGRPSLMVLPVSARAYVLAFSVGVDRLSVARVGLGGVVLDREDLPRPRRAFALDEIVDPLSAVAERMMLDTPAGALCVGSGAAVCGMARTLDGAAGAGPDPAWTGKPLAERLAGRLGLARPVAIGTDADLGALAEHTRGVATDFDDVLYVHGDVTVGAGIIVGGLPLQRRGGNAAEVGHMVVNPEGRPCVCGSRGCWVTEIGEQALLRAAGWASVEVAVDAAGRGDSRAQGALRRVGDWLGFGVANLINVFSPEVVIFGGSLRDIYLAAAAQVRSRLRRMGLPAARDAVRLRTPALGADAPLIGAAELAFFQLLADPLEVGAAP